MDFPLFTMLIGVFGLVFLVLFVALAVHRPEIKATSQMAGAYFFGTLAVILATSISDSYIAPFDILDEYALWISGLFMTLAIGERARWRPDYKLVMTIYLTGTIGLLLFDGRWHLAVMDSVICAIGMLAVPALAQHRKKSVDRVLLLYMISFIGIVSLRIAVLLLNIYPAAFYNVSEFHFAMTMMSTSILGLIIGNIIGFVIAADMIAEHASAAMVDTLTGLMNRRGLWHSVDEIAKSSSDTLDGRAVLIFDIDHFKTVNDAYGHGVGDEVLERVGETTASLMQYHGVSARTGGEEFTLLFNTESAVAAFVIAEHLRVAISLIQHVNLPEGKRVTVSMGLAYIREDEALKRTILRADAALYSAKDAGRNRLRLADGDSLPDVDEDMNLHIQRIQPHDLQRRKSKLKVI